MRREKMVILTGYVGGETYGLLGPQLAASIVQENTIYDCIVVTVTRDDDQNHLKKTLQDYFGNRRPVIGFSYLAGRTDLFTLARELREEGSFTILAGPQADVDFAGEKGWQDHPHYFQGLSSCFSMALHGPAERILPFLNRPIDQKPSSDPGLINATSTWNEQFLTKVHWDNLYRLRDGALTPLPVTTGQVLQQIGCPHASQTRTIEIDSPVAFRKNEEDKLRLSLKGCSFCDVAVDKGFHGVLSLGGVLEQIQRLPEHEDGCKIPFELINENAVPGLPALLAGVRARGIRLSQINLTLRADWFVLAEKILREALALAGALEVRILLASMGFEPMGLCPARRLGSRFHPSHTLGHRRNRIKQQQDHCSLRVAKRYSAGPQRPPDHPSCLGTGGLGQRDREERRHPVQAGGIDHRVVAGGGPVHPMMEYRSEGVSENWSNGVLEYWSVGVLECWTNSFISLPLLQYSRGFIHLKLNEGENHESED
ncbi:MAG: uncharacterized protein H6R37_977 [Deltaproteobacteria bacterium]|nr:uncharacterized protein [Deltaproteobacteria bacterium]